MSRIFLAINMEIKIFDISKITKIEKKVFKSNSKFRNKNISIKKFVILLGFDNSGLTTKSAIGIIAIKELTKIKISIIRKKINFKNSLIFSKTKSL